MKHMQYIFLWNLSTYSYRVIYLNSDRNFRQTKIDRSIKFISVTVQFLVYKHSNAFRKKCLRDESQISQFDYFAATFGICSEVKKLINDNESQCDIKMVLKLPT